jgi:hypothetical protein
MSRSTFRQPLPSHLALHLSKAYDKASGEPKPFELVRAAPAGALSATGEDMGRFMIAHLQQGAGGAGRILQPQTVETMHRSAFRLLPPLNSMRLGFYETGRGGVQAIGHGGDTQWMHSNLQLYPQANTGLFLSINSSGVDGAAYTLRTQILNGFMDRYLGARTFGGQVAPTVARQHASLVAGNYITSRRADSSFMALTGLLGQTVVSVNEDGTLSVSAFQHPNGEPRKWREIAPMIWTDEEGKERLSVRLQQGRVTMFSTDDGSPQEVFLPVSTGRSAGWLIPAVVASLAALALLFLSWPIAALTRRYYGGPLFLKGREAWFGRMVRIAAIGATASFLGFAVLIYWLMGDLRRLGPSSDPIILILQGMAMITFVGGALIGLWNVWRVRTGNRRLVERLWSLIVAFAFLVLLWTASIFHQIPFGVEY